MFLRSANPSGCFFKGETTQTAASYLIFGWHWRHCSTKCFWEALIPVAVFLKGKPPKPLPTWFFAGAGGVTSLPRGRRRPSSQWRPLTILIPICLSCCCCTQRWWCEGINATNCKPFHKSISQPSYHPPLPLKQSYQRNKGLTLTITSPPPPPPSPHPHPK